MQLNKTVIAKLFSKLNQDSNETGEPPRSHQENSLAEAVHGIWQQVHSLVGPQDACHRLLELGFTPGTEVQVVQSSPWGGPLIVLLRGTRLALRKDEAAWIIVNTQ